MKVAVFRVTDVVTGVRVKRKLKGTDELKGGLLSTNILIEAWDGTGSPSHYESDGLMPATFSNK